MTHPAPCTGRTPRSERPPSAAPEGGQPRNRQLGTPPVAQPRPADPLSEELTTNDRRLTTFVAAIAVVDRGFVRAGIALENRRRPCYDSRRVAFRGRLARAQNGAGRFRVPAQHGGGVGGRHARGSTQWARGAGRSFERYYRSVSRSEERRVGKG